jgi:predicted acetyltransferase
MVELAQPHARFHRSFLAAVDEFLALGEERYAGLLSLAGDDGFEGICFTRASLEDPREFQRLVDYRLNDALPDSPRPAGWVPCTTRWLAHGDEYLGAINLRHSLDHPQLRDEGGHIGYAVRPTARRRGYAADALRQMVRIAGAMGISRVLVTCDLDNIASARTIESGGGVYEGDLNGKRRYWIDTPHAR